MIRVPSEPSCAPRPARTRPPARGSDLAALSRPLRYGARRLGIATIGAAHAQTSPARSALPDAQTYDRDIVGRPPGATPPTIPNVELSEEDIARYGANTIADLLADAAAR